MPGGNIGFTHTATATGVSRGKLKFVMGKGQLPQQLAMVIGHFFTCEGEEGFILQACQKIRI